ncbi:MAG TPA: sigma-70 family RNA polymerase sigma factor, partial [Vineibacter sp.]|nr:sigma-70 family RNA polymerase sigma factor [Vineibacter sp.]
MSTSTAGNADARAAFDRLLGELRPKLHRYCARMTGSVIDGEDVLQEALVKAIRGLPQAGTITSAEGWLFRIAHNAALDFLRRRSRQDAIHADADLDRIIDPDDATDARQVAAASLRTFMRLPVTQRSSVILMDVLGYSLQEIASVMDATIPTVKAALHRGRTRLRQLAQEPDDHPFPALAAPEQALLAAYVERFNARDFDAIRDLLA